MSIDNEVDKAFQVSETALSRNNNDDEKFDNNEQQAKDNKTNFTFAWKWWTPTGLLLTTTEYQRNIESLNIYLV